eukprot:gene32390-43275_t
MCADRAAPADIRPVVIVVDDDEALLAALRFSLDLDGLRVVAHRLKPNDKAQLAKARYVNTPVAAPFRRAIVDYHRKELPGSIVVDSDNHYLYYVQEGGKAIRYGVTVGEEALAFSGVARVGNMAEWPKWTPTKDIHARIEGLPAQSARRSR